MSSLSVKFPLVFSAAGTSTAIGYEAFEDTNINDIGELVKFNLKNIILTHPGERTWDSDFGVGIKQYLFEMGDNPALLSFIESSIAQQIGRYAPYVQVTNINVAFSPDNNTLGIRLNYKVNSYGLSSALDIYINDFSYSVNSENTRILNYDVDGDGLADGTLDVTGGSAGTLDLDFYPWLK